MFPFGSHCTSNMYRDTVEANVCNIIRRKYGNDEVLGSGCLVRIGTRETCLKVATSEKLFQKSGDAKFLAVFINPLGEKWTIELSSRDKEFRNNDIAFFSLDKSTLGLKATACHEGIPVSSQSTLDANRCQVLVRPPCDDVEPIVSLYSAELDGRCSLKSLDKSIVIGTLDDCDGLAIRGSPILDLDKTQFLGIVDFSEADDGLYLVPFSCHGLDSDSTKNTAVHGQETQPAGFEGYEGSKLSSDDLIEQLWEDQYFCDELCKALDLEHSASDSPIKNWRHLAQEFKIPQEVRQKISGSKISPTETLFEYLKSTRPNFKIRNLCTSFENAKLHQVLRHIKEGKLKQEDDVSELADKDPDLLRLIIIKLDSRELWKRLASELDVPDVKCQAFLRDPNVNPTKMFFEILRTQSPRLEISVLKSYLKTLKEATSVLEGMKSVPNNKLLKDLPSEAALMCDVIEPKFNATKNNLLYKLAELFQKDDYLRGIDINDFCTSENQESPTSQVIDYVLTSQPVQYKIKHLMDILVQIERCDCNDIVKMYIKGCEDVDQVVNKLKRELHIEPAKTPRPIEREFSASDDKNEVQE